MTGPVAAEAGTNGIFPWVVAALASTAAVVALVQWARAASSRRSLEKQLAERERTLDETRERHARLYEAVDHEMRGPTNGVLGLSRMLRETVAGNREQFLVSALHRCAENLRTTIEDLAALPSFGTGNLSLHAETFELSELVNSTLGAADLSAEKARLGAWTGPKPVVKGDAGKLGQILSRLVGNALRHGAPAAATVDVDVADREDGRCGVTFTVKNPGPDLPKEELDALFHRFERAGYGSRRRVGGSGLGLYACRCYAEAIGATLTAGSFGGITEFRLSLSLEKVDSPAPKPAAARPRGRVLVVEDEDYNRLVLGNLLADVGFTVDWAVDGRSALAQVANQRFDLVLTDWMLPDMDGAELTHRLLERCPTPKPPVFAVTAYSGARKEAEARAAGMAGMISKPLTLEKLASALRPLRDPPTPANAPVPDRQPEDNVTVGTLARLGPLDRVAPEFIRRLEDDWRRVESAVETDRRAGAQLAHRIISAGLVVHARVLCDGLRRLEKLLNENTDEREIQRVRQLCAAELRRVIGVVASAGGGPMVSEDPKSS